MPELLGFGIHVEMEGVRLPEFQPEVSYEGGRPVATCWIPSEAGKEFKVVVDAPGHRPYHWSFALVLDGTRPTVVGTMLRRSDIKPTLTLAEEEVYHGARRSFQFASLQLTDDDAALNSANEKLGEISLELSTVAEFVRSLGHSAVAPVQTSGRVHERSKKAMAHCIKYGEIRPTVGEPLTWWSAVGKQHVGTVVFRYRNMDVLVAQGIAPKASLPAAASNPAAGPSNPRKRKAEKIKSEVIEISDSDDEPGPSRKSRKIVPKKEKVKSEAVPTFVPGEIIDLT